VDQIFAQQDWIYNVFIEFQTLDQSLCVTRTNQEVANIQVIVSTRILASQLFVEIWQESPSRLLISLPGVELIKVTVHMSCE
jgi:hypothetical protein